MFTSLSLDSTLQSEFKTDYMLKNIKKNIDIICTDEILGIYMRQIELIIL